MPFIPPELRENRGEIEAAHAGQLPTLIELADIKGDLHAPTNATDGRDTLAAMARAAQARGLQYLAVTEHSPRLNGLDVDRLRRQMGEIDQLNDTLNGFTLLKGIEVDILENGAIDNPYVTILAHPADRILQERPALDIDLPDRYCRMAKEEGVPIVICTDAHSSGDLAHVRYGVGYARRRWLAANDVVNTWPLADLRALIKTTRG
ncbi:MAG: hypothetical protein HY308_07070 [Gammaproteobacteria bacterium]|nr:hypothetical protein [Gammaproteobacteria bacterium]